MGRSFSKYCVSFMNTAHLFGYIDCVEHNVRYLGYLNFPFVYCNTNLHLFVVIQENAVSYYTSFT